MSAGPRPADLSQLSWTDVLAAARDDFGLRTVRDLTRLCESVINLAGLSAFNSMGSPRKDAAALVYETLEIRDHSDRYLDARVTPLERSVILDRLELRVSGPTPVPYLTGEAFFAGRRFSVRPGIFIPRSALGHLLDDVLTEVDWSEHPRALEIGCGSGALGICVALRAPAATVDLVDVDPLAVEVTTANIERHRLTDRVRAQVSDMYDRVDPAVRYDLVLANLPYVPEVQKGWTNGEIDAEPSHAVYRPGDGLDLVRTALDETVLHLGEQGLLVLEVGTGNEPPVRDLLAGRGRWWTLGERSAGVVSLTRDELKG